MASGQIRYEQFLADLKSEYRPQREWSEGRGIFLVVGHFLVGVAGGAWVYGQVLNYSPSLVAAFVLAAAGGLAHLINLGRPERFWRMLLRVRTSWVARGFWGLSLFLVGGLLCLPPLIQPAWAWSTNSLLAHAGEALAWVGAVVMIGYMGFAYMVSKGIPFWNSSLHPILYITYAARGGAGAVLILAAFFGQPTDSATGLLLSWIIITAAVIILWGVEIVNVLSSGDDAARWSLHELFRGHLVRYLYVGTLFVGLVVPAFLMSGVALPRSALTLAMIGLSSIIGDLFMKLSSVKAGVHLPIRI
jgi:formate-dependent nitrite reductase membrane component NrfD